MGLKYQACKTSSSSILFSVRYRQEPPVLSGEDTFNGDLRDVKFAWNKLCFGPSFEKLKLAVFSKTWPIGAGPGGMELEKKYFVRDREKKGFYRKRSLINQQERHASTLYHALAGKGHEIHVFTAPSDRKPHLDIHEGNLHVYFTANDHGSLNCSLAFKIFSRINENGEFDYVHTESVSLPHWRAKLVPNVAVTWHGICVYQLPSRNVHVILNGVDTTRFVLDPDAGARLRRKYGVPDNGSLVMGVAGRLVRGERGMLN
ncbi:hypothetical protein DKX38_017598 [Salix brachista]|uniref:Glycosyltransferase subfamily 4-like N-terminal domain-containing protein n=1 Tax=Salix brachista TaxID=2182728 RepID=A0A5N5KVW4_9ROSI|nr:hypothetical protein DKX38_017598 [Salix brachista]